MMNSIAVMLILNDHIYKSAYVFSNIKESVDAFNFEASVIEYAKCVLINKQELDDFCVDGYCVEVSKSGDTYYLDSDMGSLRLETYDGLILDYNSE